MARKHSAASVEIGERIARLRADSGVSARRLAHCADMDLTNYQRIERGEGNPTISTLVQIAVALEVDVAELVTGLEAEHLQNGRAPYGHSQFDARRRDRREGW